MTDQQPAIRLNGLTKEFGAVTRRRPRRPRDRGRRVLLHARTVRVGQDHRAAPHRRVRAAELRNHRAVRPGRHQEGAVRPRRQHGLPGLCALPAHVRARQRRLRTARPGRRTRRTPRAGDEGARGRAARADGRAQALAAVRRSASARRPRPRDRRAAQGAAAGRAARRARPQTPRADAGRAQADPARPRHHVHLRHARPGGGADALGPGRRLPRWPHRAARDAAGSLRAAGVALRGRLRGDLQPVRPRSLRRADRARGRALDPPGEADARQSAGYRRGRAFGTRNPRGIDLPRQRHPSRHRSRCGHARDGARAQRPCTRRRRGARQSRARHLARRGCRPRSFRPAPEPAPIRGPRPGKHSTTAHQRGSTP